MVVQKEETDENESDEKESDKEESDEEESHEENEAGHVSVHLEHLTQC